MHRILAACLVAVALAGCTASAEPLATAHEVRPAADEAAALWSEDAVLLSVNGIEGEYGGDHDVDEEATAKSGDDERMDGRLERWSFRYVSETRNGSYTVVVDEQGAVRHSSEGPYFGFLKPLGDTIDSDEALDIAREEDSGFAKSLESGDRRGLWLNLHRTDEDKNPVWTLIGGAHGDDGGSGGIVRVDAVTGEVLFHAGGSGS